MSCLFSTNPSASYLARQLCQGQACQKCFAAHFRTIPLNHPEFGAEVGHGHLQTYRLFGWRWESSRQRPVTNALRLFVLFCCNTPCSDLIHWGFALFPDSVTFLPVFWWRQFHFCFSSISSQQQFHI